MVRYICENCKYNFESEIKTKCPYCGKESVSEEKSAEDLVNSVKVE